jgi:hypothetical protein
LTVQKSRKNPGNLCENDGQRIGKEFAAAPSFGFAPQRDCGCPIAAARSTRRGRPLGGVTGAQALRIALLGAVFAFSSPLSMNQGDVQAREVDTTSTVPMIGGPSSVRPDRAHRIFGLAGFLLEKRLMSLPDAKAQSSASENPAQESEHPTQATPNTAQATPNPGQPTPNAAQATPNPQPIPNTAQATPNPSQPTPNATEATPSATQPTPNAAQAIAPAARRPVNEIDEYLWSVYQRSGTKRDSTGDFTWKDEAAAARLGLVTKEYVIGGMDRDFRELLYDLGHAMDADGINWTILSAFRDDYRQGIASGFKAHRGYSFHGGSVATGGYGHGCAADLTGSDPDSSDDVWKWLDQHGEQFRIRRPMRQSDPAHIQPFGGWHDVAAQLRDKRVGFSLANLPSSTEVDGHVSSLVVSRSDISEAQFECVRSHRHGAEHLRTADLSDHLKPHMVRVFDRHHRHGRWRMLADIRNPEKRRGAETSPDTDELRRNVKLRTAADLRNLEKRRGADASPDTDEPRRGAKLRTAADIRNPEKRPAAETLLNTDETRRNARLRTVVADIRNPQKRPAAESLLNAERTHRNGRSRFADMRGPQRRPDAEALRRHARSKAHLHFVGPLFDSARKRS